MLTGTATLIFLSDFEAEIVSLAVQLIAPVFPSDSGRDNYGFFGHSFVCFYRIVCGNIQLFVKGGVEVFYRAGLPSHMAVFRLMRSLWMPGACAYFTHLNRRQRNI